MSEPSSRSRRLLDPLLTTKAMRAVFSDHGRLQAMLDFEAALARAEAAVGVVPETAAAAIAAQCGAELYDIDALAARAAAAGNLAIPLVQELTARVAQRDAQAAGFVHWGATSQDVIDTGLVLQLRAACDLIEADVEALAAALARLAAAHARTPLAARTLLQHALPTTFGLKLAGWLDALERDRARLRAARGRMLVLQFGGAAGTLAALGEHGPAVAAALARELGLACPALPWHTHRDRLAEAATTLGLLAGTLGKIGRDVTLLMQTEVAEALEPSAPGRGGSSTLPHKRNPVGSLVAAAAALRVPHLVATMLAAMVQEHERAAGAWHAEWEVLPEICALTAGAAAQLRQVIEGLEIDPARMRANLEQTRGLIMAEAVTMALARTLGRDAAHRLVEAASRRAAAEGRHLRDVLAADAEAARHLAAADLDRLFDPSSYIGSAEQMVERVLGEWSDAGGRK
ncbi:MAG TPA: 3-carboxy-cis,cis-muconate cycloisomerase [Burkholderiales bacterium]